MTILITRPLEQAYKTSQILESMGYNTLIDPLLEILPITPPPYNASKPQAILLTSVYGARFCPNVEAISHLPVYAVGPSTAEEARKRGFQHICDIQHGASKELCTLIATQLLPAQGDILYFSGKNVATDSVGFLQRHGFTVQRFVVYEAKPALDFSPACKDALMANRIQLALFFSPRTLETFAILIQKATLEYCCKSITSVCLSEPIYKGAQALPFKSVLRADTPRLSSVLRMLEHHVPPLEL